MRRIIAFNGPIGVGKTTTAQCFERDHGFKILSFAQPMKEALVALTGIPMEYWVQEELKKQIIPWLGITHRDLMQRFATDFLRDMVHPEYFVIKMRQEFDKYPDANIAIDDLRFENEAKLVHEFNGNVYTLHRKFQVDEAGSKHKSEKPLPLHLIDYIIHSEPTVELTAAKISKFIFV